MYSPIEGKSMWGENEPPREMSQLTPNMANGRNPSPAPPQQNRWSQHYPPGTAIGDDGTPLRNSFQRDDVGPGDGQMQDPNLHEQYFGIADGGEDHSTPGVGDQHGLGLFQQEQYEGQQSYNHHQQTQASGAVRENERGHWVQ